MNTISRFAIAIGAIGLLSACANNFEVLLVRMLKRDREHDYG